STDMVIEDSIPACDTLAFSWWRAFDLDALGLTNGLAVESVDLAVFSVGTDSDLAVNIYTSTTNPPTLASLTLINSGTATITAANNNSLVNVPVVADIPSGAILVVESPVPSGTPYIVGYNDNGETGPTYASGCDGSLPDITDIDDLGADFVNWIMQVNGDDNTVGNILVNGDFEATDGTRSTRASVLDPWTIKNAVGDKIKCDTETKIVAHGGVCAFQFKGSIGESTKLQQTVDLTGLTFLAGDTLDLSAFLNANKPTTAGKIKVVVAYNDSTTPNKFKGSFGPTSGYEEQVGSVSVASSAVSKIKVMFINKSTAGKAYLDDVSLLQTSATVLSLP
ncbi:MAG TPA: hypothetical protein VHL11_00615, partial [Phototrophicaceae bacterium]|nr:hypothetical protein [Phototrophicaceae bacterium]